MKSGLYRWNWDSYTNNGEYIIKVIETDKSYFFELVKNTMRFSPAHLDMLFKKSNKVKIAKNNSPHSVKIWHDGDFTIYPYRAGIPYVFESVMEIDYFKKQLKRFNIRG